LQYVRERISATASMCSRISHLEIFCFCHKVLTCLIKKRTQSQLLCELHSSSIERFTSNFWCWSGCC